MKQVLGIDIGVSSIGWALITENENGEKAIKSMGVRIVPDDKDFHGKFVEGANASKNEDRRLKRGMRRNNQRFKLRRDQLEHILLDNGMMPDDSLLHLPKIELYALRAKAAVEQISLKELGRVLILLNQRRGFLSNRKTREDENETEYKKQMTENERELGDLTIGQVAFQKLLENPHAKIRNRVYRRRFYVQEFQRIWNTQKQFYPDVLTGSPDHYEQESLYDILFNKTIFYQRPLKSQKHLVSKCQFESSNTVSPKSSPYFQLFRIWQQIANLRAIPTGRPKDAIALNEMQRKQVFDLMHSPAHLDKKGGVKSLKKNILKNIFQVDPNDYSLNYAELMGNRTYLTFYKAFDEAGIAHKDKCLNFDHRLPVNHAAHRDSQSLYDLWHIFYSLETDKSIINALERRFGIPRDQGEIVLKKVSLEKDYGSLSVKAIRKILPHLENGMTYDKACLESGYKNPEHEKRETFLNQLPLLKPNELRNPVVEQILNQLINVVNAVVTEFGPINEIRIELARSLKNNADRREKMTNENKRNKKRNDEIAEKLKTEYKFPVVTGRDIKRYKLWQETEYNCLYCLKQVSNADLLNGDADADHILPRSRTFNDSLNNQVISHAKCNREKGQLTAFDFVSLKGAQTLEKFILQVNRLLEAGKISRSKYSNLLMPGDQIEGGFVERQIKDTQYIARKSVEILRQICPKVVSTTGSVTAFLREKWGLNHVLQELVLPKYIEIDQVEEKLIKNQEGQIVKKRVPRNWSKRDDHRHHAVDALVTACTSQSIIQKLNNLNQIFQYKQSQTWNNTKNHNHSDEENGLPFETLAQFADEQLLEFPAPMPDFRQAAKKELERILVSIKKQSKVLSPKMNRIKVKGGTVNQKTYVPRFSLHKETIHGLKKIQERVSINTRFNSLDSVKNPEIKEILGKWIEKYGSAKKAFSTAVLRKDPLLYKGKPLSDVEVWRPIHTKRVVVTALTDAQIGKITDVRIRKMVQERKEQFGSLKNALNNYEENPFYHDKALTIPIWSVTVFDDGQLIPVREKDGMPIDYVSSGGNHHLLIHKDSNGNYFDTLISNFDAVGMALQKVTETGQLSSVIDRSDYMVGDEVRKFVYDLQINDLVLIDFDFDNMDVFDIINMASVSKRLFRVQKMSKNQINFRHHLETNIDKSSIELRGMAWERFQSNNNFKRLAKVQLNNLGHIISIQKP